MFTRAPFARRAPGGGFWAITRPFFTLLENARETWPSVQLAFLSAARAAASVFPVTFGTTHCAAGDGGGGGGGGEAVVVAVQVSEADSQ